VHCTNTTPLPHWVDPLRQEKRNWNWLDNPFAVLPGSARIDSTPPITRRGRQDPRTGNAGRHDLLKMLLIALCTALCCGGECTDMAEFARIARNFTAPLGATGNASRSATLGVRLHLRVLQSAPASLSDRVSLANGLRVSASGDSIALHPPQPAVVLAAVKAKPCGRPDDGAGLDRRCARRPRRRVGRKKEWLRGGPN
jgi:hypothetical protein